MFIILPCSQRALILVLEHVGNFDARLLPGCSRYGIRVPCLCVRMVSLYATGWPVFPKCMQLTLVRWYVASMLCCHCWMFSLSDALPMQSYPSKVWVLCQCGITYLFSFLRSMFLHEIGGILWLTLWRCWLHMLFIHASNLLPLNSPHHSPTYRCLFSSLDYFSIEFCPPTPTPNYWYFTDAGFVFFPVTG